MGWTLFDPGKFGYRLAFGLPLGFAGGCGLGVGIAIALQSTNDTDRIKGWVKWGRRAVRAFVYSLACFVATVAIFSIGVSLYALATDGTYDTHVMRLNAATGAMMAGGLTSMVSAFTGPHFSVVRGRSNRRALRLSAGSRVLAVVAVFATLAELIAPGTATWATVAATLLLTSTGWEIARDASAENAGRRFLDTATALQEAAARADGALLAGLTALENAARVHVLGAKDLVEGEVLMAIRACVGRAHRWELDATDRAAMNIVEKELADWSDELFREEVGKFATAIRQSLLLNVPLAPEPRKNAMNRDDAGPHPVETKVERAR